MRILILGSAAGGGFPQWNCRCPNCRLAWAGDGRAISRTQSGLAISADGETWTLINASPDLRQQIIANAAMHPRHGSRHTPIGAVVLTNGDIDHVAGLLTLRERQPFALHASPFVHDMLARNSLFGVLDPETVPRCPMVLGVPSDIGGLRIGSFAVPGKVPLYLEGAEVDIGLETDMTVGLTIETNGKRAVYIPGCAAASESVLRRIEGADLLLFDGTTYTEGEMIALGVSQKTATRMGHLAVSGPEGSLAALAGTAVARKIYVHINNTNPILIEGSPERRAVEAAGWSVAYDGMEIVL